MLIITTGGEPMGDLGIAGGETVGAGLARIGLGQFDRVAEGLAGHPDRDTGMHEARKAVKRLRALLRLVRRGLGEPEFRVHDVALRDLGRAMAPLRDARVSLDIVEEAAANCPMLHTALVERHQRQLEAMYGDPAVVGDLLVEAKAGRRRWESAFPGTLPDGFEIVGEGIARTYRRGRKRMAVARRRGGDGDYHEWRKEVKHLRYQMEALQPLDPGALAPIVGRWYELGELLGSEHDLTVVIGLVDPDAGGGDDRAGLLELLTARRAGLRDAACSLGGEAYGPKPSIVVDRLGRLWDDAHRSTPT